jgi:hypothetical protein
MIKSKNPHGVYVVAPDGRIVSHPVHVSKLADGSYSPFPSQEEIAKQLKPGWRFATSTDVKAKQDAEAKRQRAERGEPEPAPAAKSDKPS